MPKNSISPPYLKKCLAFLLFFTLSGTIFNLTPSLCNGAEPVARRILIHGQVQRPFPALFQLDYPFARAEAWLQALSNAVKYLPGNIEEKLTQAGLSGNLASLGVCALAFPVDVITPEIRVSDSIRVFLAFPDNLNASVANIVLNPWILAKEMAVIWDTTQTTAFLREHWPHSVNEARSQIELLDEKTDMLNALWQATPLLQNALNEESVSWSNNINYTAAAITVLLETAGESEDLNMAEQAVQILLNAEAHSSAPELYALWNRLLALGLYHRARAHKRQHQTALAETDLNAAVARLNKSQIKDKTAIAIVLELAELKKSRQDLAAMCDGYINACAMGDCSPLTIARQSGLCRGNI